MATKKHLMLKKYPVIYNGKNYEVRWESITGNELSPIELTIYKVTQKKRLFKTVKQYIPIYSEYQSVIRVRIVYRYKNVNDQDLYINEVKALFDMYETDLGSVNKESVLEKQRKENLEKWDGVIK